MNFDKPPIAESEPTKELQSPSRLDFYVTDHSADSDVTGDPEKLRALYADIKRDGINSVRYDWRWRNIEPQKGEYSEAHLSRYSQAKETMAEVGLEKPTIILSDIPAWAKELYKNDKEKFFTAYREYVSTVKRGLEAAGGEKVVTVQVLNELNVSVYTPVDMEDIPRLCEITREVLRDYNPDLKLMVTLLASNSARFVGTPIEQYLPKLKHIKESFDVIAVDYYPGVWHISPKDPASLRPSDLYKAMVKNLDLLRSSFQEIATWGKEYELGEVGMRTNSPFGGSEKAQRYFYDSFFRAFKHMLLELERNGIKTPSRVGLYEAIDEPPKDRKGRMLRRLAPFPEHDLGMRSDEGTRKMILQGSPHLREEERAKHPSQLQKIIGYLRAPIE